MPCFNTVLFLGIKLNNFNIVFVLKILTPKMFKIGWLLSKNLIIALK